MVFQLSLWRVLTYHVMGTLLIEGWRRNILKTATLTGGRRKQMMLSFIRRFYLATAITDIAE